MSNRTILVVLAVLVAVGLFLTFFGGFGGGQLVLVTPAG